MAIWDFRPRGDVLTGVAIGVGVLAAPVALPLAWTAVRPLLKVILKSGFVLYETGRRAFGEDLVGTDLEKPEKAQAAKVETVRHREEKTAQPKPALKIEKVAEPKSKENRETPAPVKPKRQAKTAKKKSDKEN